MKQRKIELTHEELDNIDNDIIQEHLKALRQPFVKKPISYALYQVWKKYDEIEKPRDMRGEE